MNLKNIALLAVISLTSSVGCATIKADSTVKPNFDFSKIGKVGLVQVAFGNAKAPQDFEAASNQIGDIMLMEFMRKGYETVERNQIEAVLKEQQFQHSGMTEQDAVQVGKILNLKAVIIINVVKCSDEIVMTAKMIDTQTASHLWISTGEGDTNKGLTSLLTTVGGGVAGAGIGTAVGGKGKGTVLGAVGGAFGGMVAGKLLEPSLTDCVKKVCAKMTEILPRGS